MRLTTTTSSFIIGVVFCLALVALIGVEHKSKLLDKVRFV
jgi:hypothetical protein